MIIICKCTYNSGWVIILACHQLLNNKNALNINIVNGFSDNKLILVMGVKVTNACSTFQNNQENKKKLKKRELLSKTT